MLSGWRGRWWPKGKRQQLLHQLIACAQAAVRLQSNAALMHEAQAEAQFGTSEAALAAGGGGGRNISSKAGDPCHGSPMNAHLLLRVSLASKHPCRDLGPAAAAGQPAALPVGTQGLRAWPDETHAGAESLHCAENARAGEAACCSLRVAACAQPEQCERCRGCLQVRADGTMQHTP